MKTLVRRMKIILRQEKSDHQRIESPDPFDIGDNRHTSAFTKIKRPIPKSFCDRRISGLKSTAESTVLISWRIRTSRRRDQVRNSTVGTGYLYFHSFRRPLFNRFENKILDRFRILIGHQSATDFRKSTARDHGFTPLSLISAADRSEEHTSELQSRGHL